MEGGRKGGRGRCPCRKKEEIARMFQSLKSPCVLTAPRPHKKRFSATGSGGELFNTAPFNTAQFNKAPFNKALMPFKTCDNPMHLHRWKIKNGQLRIYSCERRCRICKVEMKTKDSPARFLRRHVGLCHYQDRDIEVLPGARENQRYFFPASLRVEINANCC